MPGYAHLRRPRSGRFCAYLCRRQFRSSVVPHFRRSAVLCQQRYQASAYFESNASTPCQSAGGGASS